MAISERDILDLADMVADKAQGVFLWVYLVVSALKEHMKACNPIDELYRCVDWFPPHLEDYFREFIYKRIPSALREDTTQALKLAWLILRHEETEQPGVSLDRVYKARHSLSIRKRRLFRLLTFP